MSSKLIQGILSADVATSGTFAVTLPTGFTAGHFYGAVNHSLVMAQSPLLLPSQFTLSLSGSTCTITNRGTGTWLAGSAFTLELDMVGAKAFTATNGFTPNDTGEAQLLILSLGSPALGVANAISLSASNTAGAAVAIVGSVYSTDVPRNVVAAWTGTAVLTVTGTDEYGVAMTESSASGTSFTGKKAFKRVTGATFSANVTSATIGTGAVLGLPIFLPAPGLVLRELVDGVAPTAGTIVAGVNATLASATTGDVRGTYTANGALDGAKAIQLVCAIPDPGFKGITQA